MKLDHDIELGVVGIAHGLRGEVTLHLHNPSSDALVPDLEVRLTLPTGATRTLKVLAQRDTGKGRIVAFEGVTDRTAAEALKGARLVMLRSALPAPGPGEFYYDDMPGVPVRLPDGTEVGTVTYAFRGATDILAMNVDGREVLVPCVAGFVVSVGSDVVVIEPLALEEPL